MSPPKTPPKPLGPVPPEESPIPLSDTEPSEIPQSTDHDPSEIPESSKEKFPPKDKGKAPLVHTVPPLDSPIHPSHKKKFPTRSEYSTNNKSPYHEKIELYHACYVDIDNSQIGFFDPNDFAKQTYYYGSHFPQYGYKTRFWYELILEDSLSCQFTHSVRGRTVLPHLYSYQEWEFHCSYSKAIISKVIPQFDWPGNMSSAKKFRNVKVPGSLPKEYNYWDYIDAWFHAFLMQNIQVNHSWFIRLDLPGEVRYFPNWFYLWLVKYGPEIDIIPPPLSPKFLSYRNSLIRLYQPVFSNDFVCQFFRFFRIPWILSWKHILYRNSSLPSLGYQFWIRWWDKFNISLLLNPTPLVPSMFGRSATFPSMSAIYSEPKVITSPVKEEFPFFPENYTTLQELKDRQTASLSLPQPTIHLNDDNDPFDPIIMTQEDITQVLVSIQTPSPQISPQSSSSSSASCPDTLFGHDSLPSQPSLCQILPHCFFCGKDGHYIKDCPDAREDPAMKKI